MLTLLAANRISRALDRLHNPGVESSLGRSATLSRELVDRLRFEAFQILEDLPLSPPPADRESIIREKLVEADYDFVAWELPGEETRVVAVESDSGAVRGHPDADDWIQLRAGTAPAVEVGQTLRFFEPPGPPTDHGRAIGLRVSAEVAEAVRLAADDYARYVQLRIFKEVQKKLVWFWSGVVFLLAAAAAFTVSRITARHISRPVAVPARTAEIVAAGDLTARAEVEAHGQIGDLVTSFNRMTSELKRSQDELVRVERIAAWRDVARRIAHEIRNPLTPVKLAIHRLKARVPEDPVSQECLRSIGEEVDNLNRISESFSEFAKMPDARFAPTDLAKVARSVTRLFEGSKAVVTVTYEGPDELPLVADRNQLRRAVTNLVKHAVEAVAEGGNVIVRVREDRGRGIVEVADDGPGIAPEIRDTLFRPGVSARPGGSGLGLSMVHRIATDHKGALKLHDSEGGGARFALEIPLSLTESE